MEGQGTRRENPNSKRQGTRCKEESLRFRVEEVGDKFVSSEFWSFKVGRLFAMLMVVSRRGAEGRSL